jgi:L-amino acid N-acyltransferase YncA
MHPHEGRTAKPGVSHIGASVDGAYAEEARPGNSSVKSAPGRLFLRQFAELSDETSERLSHRRSMWRREEEGGMAESVSVRPARMDDAAAIAEIYNQGIRARIATFETEERTPEERRAWLAGHDARHPVVVATISERGAERVVGWAATDGYRARTCYAGVAEFSVYIHEAYRGRGVGVAVLNGLIEAAERAGLWKLLSRVFPENAASRALCAKVGFREVGVYQNHGKLDGAWKDTVIVERLIPANVT